MGLAPAPEFSDFEPALHAAACEATGFSDFGNDDYLTGLRQLIEAYATDLPDTPEARQSCFALTLPGLIGRLHSEHGFRATPECLSVPIRRPLIIAGVPRTGTTALHMLLARDPQFQGLQHWIIPNPIVRPARAQWPHHALHRAAAERVRALAETSPKANRVHTVGVDDVDECLALMMQSFVTNQLPSLLNLPSYDTWYLRQDEAESYRRLADNLRLIGNAEPEKTWLLKNPTHLLRMQSLLTVFPDARIIHTHRDPVETFGSLCSMLAAFRGNPEPGSPEACVIGPRQLRLYSDAIRHTMDVREQHAEAFHDVHQSRLETDPMGVVSGIYARFELELSAEAEQRMRAWVAEQPVSGRPEHRYRPEDYGLHPSEIRDTLHDYIERYGLERSGAPNSTN